MSKLILLSIIIAAIVIPARAVRAKDPREGLKKTLRYMAIAMVVYAILLTQVWLRLLG